MRVFDYGMSASEVGELGLGHRAQMR